MLLNRVLSVVILFAGATLGSHVPTGSEPQSAEPFEFAVEMTSDGASFESRAGTAWKEATWTCEKTSPCQFFVGHAGVAGREVDLAAEGFCIDVKLLPGGIELKSVRGTNWITLTYGAGTNRAYRCVVNENGVSGL